MNKLKTIFRSLHWKNILGLTIAGLINAFGITIFLSPVNLYDSGISGTSMLLSQITPEHLSLSVFLIILNIPLFLYGWKKQGSTFTIYAIYVVAIYSLGAWLITDVLPVDVRFVSPLAGSDLLLCALFGGLKRTCDPFWRCNGRYRDTCDHICQTPWHHRRNLCYGL